MKSKITAVLMAGLMIAMGIGMLFSSVPRAAAYEVHHNGDIAFSSPSKLEEFVIPWIEEGD